jgi:hypothetical protein
METSGNNMWKTIGGFVNNVITGGGYSALTESSTALDVQLDKHRESVQTFETANSAFRAAVESLGGETAECMVLLRASQDFVERLSYSAFSSNLPNLPVFGKPDLSNVSATLSTFDATITAGKGAGLGLVASAGAWVLVAHLGTASTGAAISGLAGVAAHNAILAWFGGGALAAGGGGMLIGSLALSAIALIPVVAFSAYKSYKEAARLDHQRKEVMESATLNRDNADKLVSLRDSAETLRMEIGIKRGVFAAKFEQSCADALQLAEKTAMLANAFAESLALMPESRHAVPPSIKLLTE